VRASLVVAGLALLALAAGGACLACMARMPGESPAAPAATPPQDVAARLRAGVEALHALGERSTRRPAALRAAADLLAGELAALGLAVERQGYDCDAMTVENLEAALPGGARAGETLVIGAHYDSAPGTPGADDNASGSVALLELARRLAARDAAEPAFPRLTLRLVLYTNEEPPHFKQESMGSLVHARSLAARGERVVAMLSLECLGYYSDEPGSQQYPAPFSLFYPDAGNFLGFVGNFDSGDLVRRCVAAFRASGALPCEGVATFSALQGIDWSDHWSYWESGYPGVMVTDTAIFRNPHYHEASDGPDTLDYARLARAVDGLEAVIVALDAEVPP
jgi:Peptidase family M28